jgi:hypothetical protein
VELFLTLLTQHGRSVVCTEKTISSCERRFRLVKQEEEEEEEKRANVGSSVLGRSGLVLLSHLSCKEEEEEEEEEEEAR